MSMKPKIDEPLYISPRTYRDYELYRWECGRAIGWNQAMDFIFGERKDEKRQDHGVGIQGDQGSD